MSCRAAAHDALSLCTAVLACREEFPGEYRKLRSLLDAQDASRELKCFLQRPFVYEQYHPGTAAWQSRQRSVDVVEILETRKLNHEEEDRTTRLNLLTASRLRPKSLHYRVFCGVSALLNGRAVAEHLERATRGRANVRGSEIVRLADEVRADVCFTDAFDVRTYRLPPAEKELRKMSRLLCCSRRRTTR